jgi:hypothetical protein
MSFLYETHLHTSFASACAESKGSEYIKIYKDLGYSGIVVTDHFYNGNTSIPRSLPWKEWVNRFCRGYEEARNEGERRGLDVFFGWEDTFDGCGDYLVYGLDKQWLLEHPECRRWTRSEQYRAVKEAGGCVVQAHPFRQHYWIRRIILSPECVDGVETANGGQGDPSFDALAFRYAKKINKTMIAGTDIHDASRLYNGNILGVYLHKKLSSIADFAQAICSNGIAGLKADPPRSAGGETVSLPVEIRDANDRIIGRKWKEYV